MAKQPTSNANVADETDSPAENAEPSWLLGYQASDPKDANSPDRPSYEPYVGPGENAVALKKKWQGRPSVLPNGEGDDGSF